MCIKLLFNAQINNIARDKTMSLALILPIVIETKVAKKRNGPEKSAEFFPLTIGSVARLCRVSKELKDICNSEEIWAGICSQRLNFKTLHDPVVRGVRSIIATNRCEECGITSVAYEFALKDNTNKMLCPSCFRTGYFAVANEAQVKRMLYFLKPWKPRLKSLVSKLTPVIRQPLVNKEHRMVVYFKADVEKVVRDMLGQSSLLLPSKISW